MIERIRKNEKEKEKEKAGRQALFYTICLTQINQ
jgi:hypothetical protein